MYICPPYNEIELQSPRVEVTCPRSHREFILDPIWSPGPPVHSPERYRNPGHCLNDKDKKTPFSIPEEDQLVGIFTDTIATKSFQSLS